MSAQIIRALAVRADALDGEAARMEAAGVSETPDPGGRSVRELRLIAAEFRALAEAAQQP